MKNIKLKSVLFFLVVCISTITFAQQKWQIGLDVIPNFSGISDYGDHMNLFNLSVMKPLGSTNLNGVEIGRIVSSGEGYSASSISICYVSRGCYYFKQNDRLGVFFDTKFGIAFAKSQVDLFEDVIKTSDTLWDFGFDAGVCYKCTDAFSVELALSDEFIFLFKDVFDSGASSDYMGIKFGASYLF